MPSGGRTRRLGERIGRASRPRARADERHRLRRQRPAARPAHRTCGAEGGGHQVTLTWDAVAGAVGYQVYAAPDAAGPWEPLDHAGRDVLAVPHPPYADTTGKPGSPRWYAVASLSDVHVEGERSEPVEATPTEDATGPVRDRASTSATTGASCPGRGGR